ncbi:hypothetical protein ACW7EJ_00160, partial [Acinetobacter soli]
MTQDVILENPSSLKELISGIIKNNNVFMAYGRQIADRQKGNWFEKRARQFINNPICFTSTNFPSRSLILELICAFFF